MGTVPIWFPIIPIKDLSNESVAQYREMGTVPIWFPSKNVGQMNMLISKATTRRIATTADCRAARDSIE
jgi:hypothetical protein